MAYTHNRILFDNKKKGSTNTCYNMNEPWKHYKWKNLFIKGYMLLYDSFYMKCPGKPSKEENITFNSSVSIGTE